MADASYVLKGKWETWTPTDGKNGASIRTYVVGNSKNVIIVAHDIFGPTSGRLVEICDELAKDLNVRVVLPDFFHGKPFLDDNTYGAPVPPNDTLFAKCGMLCRLCRLCGFCRLCCSLCCDRRRMYWDRVSFDFEEIVLDRLGSDTSVGVLGFCWGGWFTFRASSHPSVSCGVTCHPSLDICRFTGEDMETVCDLIKCPQLVLAAGDDRPNVKAGGVLDVSLSKNSDLRKKCEFHEYKAMRHGWVNRGDLKDSATLNDVNDALRRTKRFFRQHLLKNDDVTTSPSSVSTSGFDDDDDKKSK